MSIQKLPDAELEVIQALWACREPATRADMEAILNNTHPMAHTTLLTLLTRLAEKGFVKIERSGRAAAYYPLVTREDYLAQQSKRFLDKLCGGSIRVFANALCHSGLSKEDLKELQTLLEKGEL
jgi:predicted transcriptional regulator